MRSLKFRVDKPASDHYTYVKCSRVHSVRAADFDVLCYNRLAACQSTALWTLTRQVCVSLNEG